MSGAISATTLGIVAGVGAAGSIGGALIGSNAAGHAADTQANAANQAAQLQYQASQNALDFQKQQYNQNQANLAPWLKSGEGALGNLDYLMGIGPQGMSAGTPGGAGSPGQPMLPNPGTPTGGNAGGLPVARPMAIQGGSGSMGVGMPNPQTGPIRAGSGSLANPSMPTAHTGPVQAGSGGLGISATGRPSMPTAHAGAVPAFGGQSGSMQAGTPGVPQPGPNQPTGGTAGPGMTPNTSLGGYGSLMQPFQGQFTAPTNLTEQNDPGFQARLNLGMSAMDRSAAARGSVLTGGTAQAENQAAQDYASNEYGNVYNRAFNQYAQQYNQYEQGQQNQYNRLAGMSGMGQQTAQQLGYLGNQAAQGVSQNLLSTAGQMGQDYQNAGAANASGYVGAANAWGGALNGVGGNLQNLLLLQQLQGGGSSPLTIGSNGSVISPGY